MVFDLIEQFCDYALPNDNWYYYDHSLNSTKLLLLFKTGVSLKPNHSKWIERHGLNHLHVNYAVFLERKVFIWRKIVHQLNNNNNNINNIDNQLISNTNCVKQCKRPMNSDKNDCLLRLTWFEYECKSKLKSFFQQ